MGMFDGLVSGAVGAIGSLLGGAQSNQKSWDIAQASNAASAQMSQAQMDFQERMRATQYQTTVDDLQKAGLNPMLAYTQGGAGTPAGSQGTVQRAEYRDAISPAIHTGLSAMANAADLKLKEEQAAATTAQAEVARTQAINNISQEAKINQDTSTSAAVEQVNRKQLESIAAEIQLKKSQSVASSAQAAESMARVKGDVTQDPWYVQWVKKGAHSAQQAWQEKIKPQNIYLQGK